MVKRSIQTSLLIVFITLYFFSNISVGFAQTPIVRAVLFYSTTCGHCHKIITEDLPLLFEKYPDQLMIIGINVSEPDGQNLYQNAIKHYQIPQERLGVPTLIIGDVVLVGSLEIPEKLPGLIESGLLHGGIDWPDIPELKSLIAQQIESDPSPPVVTATTTAVATASPATTEILIDEPIATIELEDNLSITILERFKRDLVGNLISVFVLIGMIGSVLLTAHVFLSEKESTLQQWQDILIPILTLAGLVVSIYMTFVEVSQTEAVCGPVGDCNTVQTSPYAYLFGQIPIGVIGILGYTLFLIIWIIRYFSKGLLKDLSTLTIWGMAWFGVMFSIYLTFLEPFVIGATCMWCISSAVIMTFIMLLSTPAAKSAFNGISKDQPELDPDLFET